MKYQPITDEMQKKQFIDWLTNMANDLDGRPEVKADKNVFPNSENGDIATCKDMVGNFLATLSGKDVTIN